MSIKESLEIKVRSLLACVADITEKRMFGGVCFMLRGNMLLAVSKDRLMCRLGKPGAEAALAEPHVRPMDFSGRAMAGYVYVDLGDTQGDADLAKWIERCVAFVEPMPVKAKAPKPVRAQKPAKAAGSDNGADTDAEPPKPKPTTPKPRRPRKP